MPPPAPPVAAHLHLRHGQPDIYLDGTSSGSLCSKLMEILCHYQPTTEVIFLHICTEHFLFRGNCH